jgi:hypothetical protein
MYCCSADQGIKTAIHDYKWPGNVFKVNMNRSESFNNTYVKPYCIRFFNEGNILIIS